MKKSKGVVIIAVILACLIGLGYYTTTIMSATSTSQAKTDNKTKSEGIKLGLDLSGGVSITYRIVDKNPSKTDIEDTVAKLEERAESYSTEYAVYAVGDDRITVEIPGVYDANAVLEDLGSPGSLYFIVQKGADGTDNYTYDQSTGKYKIAEGKDIDSLKEDGSIIFDGNGVKSATATYNQDQATGSKSPVVALSFKKDATEKFATATENAYKNGETIGIYYDDHFISVPTVKSGAITDGNAVIEVLRCPLPESLYDGNAVHRNNHQIRGQAESYDSSLCDGRHQISSGSGHILEFHNDNKDLPEHPSKGVRSKSHVFLTTP